MNIYNLNKKRDTRSLSKIDKYNKVLEKCYKKIKLVDNRPQSVCFFKVPLFIWGCPLYNHTECCEYILHTLKTKGFKVLLIKPSNDIFCDWSHIIHNKKPTLQYHQKKNKIISNNYNYRPIEDTALNNKHFIYDLNSYNKKN